MGRLFDSAMEEGLIRLVNEGYIKKCKVKLKQYQRVDLYVFDQIVLEEILEEFKFKTKGTVYDYPDVLPQPNNMDAYMATSNYKYFQKIAISNKLNAIGFYSIKSFGIECVFLVDVKHLKKFLKITNKCLRQDSGKNVFRDTDFNCEQDSYIEIEHSSKDDTKDVEVLRKSLPKENLVFDKASTINKVMGDIASFFKKETHELYGKLDLAYKRGIILYGDPGNGKSAMIRQIIRTIPDVAKIIINPNVMNVTNVLSALTKSLDGKKAIVIIEDIDSLITDRNRSEFLNILDGVDIKSGVYFIGTTNYPDRIDPAFMNRSGRFDRTYKIDNPTESTRRIFFKSRRIGELLGHYDLNEQGKGTDDEIVEAFVNYSDNLPMASLKEIITSTAYLLASGDESNIIDALEEASGTISGNRSEHQKSHMLYKQKMAMGNYNMPFLGNGGMTNMVNQPVMVQQSPKPTKKKKEKPKMKKITIKRV